MMGRLRGCPHTCDLEGLARLCVNPFSIDVSFGLEQRLVVELHEDEGVLEGTGSDE